MKFEAMIGEDKLIHFSGVEMGQDCTIVLQGASFHVLDAAGFIRLYGFPIRVRAILQNRL